MPFLFSRYTALMTDTCLDEDQDEDSGKDEEDQIMDNAYVTLKLFLVLRFWREGKLR